MKRFLFDATARVSYLLLWINEKVFTAPIWVLERIEDVIRAIIANVGYGLMHLIDPIKCKAVEAKMSIPDAELESQTTELALLKSAYQVRDHAQAMGDWTDQHSEAMEAIGTALLTEVGWDEEHVHNHLKEVVESIDGLTFDTYFEDEDDET